ncbi:MAG: histidine phosphatase family protein [Sphaerochaetaceae bacterium]|nr:histidine phosphatase family protein [Sphaerochaetaceae bacterium]
MKIYITRHGQTDYNKNRKVCGSTDIPLNGIGKEQAVELKENIKDKDIKFDYIFVSPLTRARETVKPLEDYFNQKAIIDERLREFDFGEKEGCDFDDPNFRKTRNDPFSVFKNGESMVRACSRVYNFFDEVKEKISSDSTILIVSHGTISRIINTYFNSVSLEEFNTFKMANCQLLEFNM